VLAALSTGNKIGLAVTAGAFVAFALAAAMLVPRYRPEFPGRRGLAPFIVVTVALFLLTMTAVFVFGQEEEEQEQEAIQSLLY
jgi:hypothetical protein